MVVVQALLRKLGHLLLGVLLGLLVVLEVKHRLFGLRLLVSSCFLCALFFLALCGLLLLRILLLFRLGLVAFAVLFGQILKFAQVHIIVVVVNNNFGFVFVHGVSSCIWLW